MDIDDDSFADNFDEDLVRAVEEQESQYFGNYTPSHAGKAEPGEFANQLCACNASLLTALAQRLNRRIFN
jgi:hypothetical protein